MHCISTGWYVASPLLEGTMTRAGIYHDMRTLGAHAAHTKPSAHNSSHACPCGVGYSPSASPSPPSFPVIWSRGMSMKSLWILLPPKTPGAARRGVRDANYRRRDWSGKQSGLHRPNDVVEGSMNPTLSRSCWLFDECWSKKISAFWVALGSKFSEEAQGVTCAACRIGWVGLRGRSRRKGDARYSTYFFQSRGLVRVLTAVATG